MLKYSIVLLSLAHLTTAAPNDPCQNVQCPSGQKCFVDQIFCYKAPCPPPRAECRSSDPQNPCQGHKCQPGQECKNVQVQCFVPPCYPIAECQDPAPQQCGRNEFFDVCTGCENTCDNKQMACPAICRSPGRCRCDVGFYRHQNGKCVSEYNCRYGIY